MKKRFVSLCLAGLIMVAPASAVFTDISDSRVSQTAAVLDALGIMQGVGGGSFAPGKALTRAQFCKLAVTAMGVTDVSPYASYTIFPDVKHSHWAAPYINAAVRHPELKDMKLNDYITLLFDADGNVAAAYPKKDVSAEMQGIVTKIGGEKATVTLTNGLTLRDIPIAKDVKTDVMGRLVTVSQSGEGADLIRRTLSGKTAGNWSVAEGKLGSNAVSSKVRVYEEVLSGAPLNAINVSDIDLTSVPASQIKYTVQDNAGTVTNIVLGDVTGESWIYGIGYGKRKNSAPKSDELVEIDGEWSEWSKCSSDQKERYKKDNPNRFIDTCFVSMKYWDGAKQEESTFRVLTLPRGLGGVPIAVPRGYSTDESIVNTSLDTLKLTLIDTVKPSAFDGSSGVRTKDGYYELAENIGVYISEQNRFISLQTAKSNYTSFRVYANKTAENGGKIRVIVAS